MSDDQFKYRGPTLFWPVLLIGVGMLLLLSNLGIVGRISFISVLRLWPLILVAVGLQILFGRDNPWMSNLIAVGVVLCAIAFLAFAPTVSWLPQGRGGALITEQFEVPDGNTDSARVTIDSNSERVEIFALHDSENMFEAEVTHGGRVEFNHSGGQNKVINLIMHEDRFFDFDSWFDPNAAMSSVGISPFVDLDLMVDHGSGSAMLDLAELQLSSLEVDSGSGPLTVVLPEGVYPALLDCGSGSLTVDMDNYAELDMRASVGSGRMMINLGHGVEGYLDLDSGSGNITITVPEGVGVWLSGSTGSGVVSVPRGWVQTRLGDDNGTWESPDFEFAETQVFIEFDVGSGNIRINQ